MAFLNEFEWRKESIVRRVLAQERDEYVHCARGDGVPAAKIKEKMQSPPKWFSYLLVITYYHTHIGF